jgi:hypothetical protein
VTARPLITLATALVAAAVMAGCSEESAGSPMPDDKAVTTTEPDITEPTSDEPGRERPREIPLDGKDPCSLIPQSDWPKLDIERPGNPSEDPTYRSPECTYPGVGQVTIVVTEGIDAWDEETRDADISDAEPIEGFPTITAWNLADQRSCYVAVDVTDGQYLMAGAAFSAPDPDQSETCDVAYRMAESAMKTLVAS